MQLVKEGNIISHLLFHIRQERHGGSHSLLQDSFPANICVVSGALSVVSGKSTAIWHNSTFQFSSIISLQAKTSLGHKQSGMNCIVVLLLVRVCSHILRVGHKRIYTPYMIVHLVTSLPKIPYVLYKVLANPTHTTCAL
jgi:hypothetical protein